jgi:hypothetical protein
VAQASQRPWVESLVVPPLQKKKKNHLARRQRSGGSQFEASPNCKTLSWKYSSHTKSFFNLPRLTETSQEERETGRHSQPLASSAQNHGSTSPLLPHSFSVKPFQHCWSSVLCDLLRVEPSTCGSMLNHSPSTCTHCETLQVCCPVLSLLSVSYSKPQTSYLWSGGTHLYLWGLWRRGRAVTVPALLLSGLAIHLSCVYHHVLLNN